MVLFFACSVCYAQQDRYAKDVAELVEKHRQFLGQDNIILFTGSSSIRMWESLTQDFVDHKVINMGFGGSEFSDLLFFRTQLVEQFNPEKVFIYEGDNDINSGKSPRKTFRDAKKLYRKLKRELPESKFYFITPKPSVSRWGLKSQYETYNQLLAKFTERKSIAYVDVWNIMLDAEGNVMKDIFIEDNLHMNAKGYSLWKNAIQPFVED